MTNLSKKQKILAILYTSLSWWSCVLAGKYLNGFISSLVLFVFIVGAFVFHYGFFKENFLKKWQKIILLIFLGLTFDLIIFKVGIIKASPGPQTLLGFFPLWLLALWCTFPLTFFHTLGPILSSKGKSLLFGAIGAPISYLAGPSLGLLELSSHSLIYEGVLWGCYMVFASFLLKD